MNNAIDHLSVGAASLEEGAAFLKDALGVEMTKGSKHAMMATHNRVMQIGNESFIEIISIDPEGETPQRRRWFSFDEPETRKRLAARPRPLCWVVRTDNLDEVVRSGPVDLGEIVHFQRGDRTWRLTVPTDGHLPEQGLLPAFIEWSPGPHPSLSQDDFGVRLGRVVLTSPQPDKLRAMLKTLQIAHLAEVEEGATNLAFELMTSQGKVALR